MTENPPEYKTKSSGPDLSLSPCRLAGEMVYGSKEAAYGHPTEDFGRQAKMLSALFAHKLKPGMELEPEDIPLFQIVAKLSRQVHRHQIDNLVDICGYAETAHRVLASKAPENE